MKNAFLRSLSLILLLFVFAACGDDDDNGGSNPPTDATNPSISSLSPANNATDIAVDANLVITFSESVVAKTGNLTLYKAGGTKVQTFNVTSDITGSGTTTITADPANNLDTQTDYYVLIDAGAFADNAGNNFAGLSADTDWAFKTGEAADVTAPTVSTLSPANNATYVALNSNLVITFSEPVVAKTGNITLYKGDGTAVQAFDVTSGISGSRTNTITMNPTNDLEAGTSYYVLIDADAFADNAGNSFAGISGVTGWAFTTDGIITGSFTDTRDGTVYKTVTIGGQVWMAENLKYLPSVVGSGTGSYTTPYYYVYGYSGTNVAEAKATTNYTAYGVLYNWEAAKAACPPGWHLPTDAEWTAMENYLADNGFNYDGTTGGTGGKIAKSLGSASGWRSSSNTGTVGNTDYPEYRNKSGFTALPGGYRNFPGAFDFIGGRGYWWSATEHYAFLAWYRYMNFSSSHVHRSYDDVTIGFSVRCVRD